jgi:hypothetical protein
MGRDVEHAPPDAHPFRAELGPTCGGRSAQDAFDASQQFARIEGFGNVVVGTHLEAHDSIDDRSGGRQHEDRK